LEDALAEKKSHTAGIK